MQPRKAKKSRDWSSWIALIVLLVAVAMFVTAWRITTPRVKNDHKLQPDSRRSRLESPLLRHSSLARGSGRRCLLDAAMIRLSCGG
jgi:hypothetical protein